MTLEQHIQEVRTGIKDGRFANEASVSQGIVLRILHALLWPPYDPQVICPEYSLSGRRVDFALCYPPTKPIAFIEVKQIGQSEGAERQLFEYAFHVGVPLAILTDGREWNFFLPGEQGDYGERRVYKLDIVERDIAECITRLERYLSYSSIVSGAAIEAAREDYRNVSRNRQIQATLPQALAKLVADEDEMLIELVAGRTEDLCGYKPDPDTVAQFLQGSFHVPLAPNLVSVSPARVQESKGTIPKPTGSIGFTLHGKFHSCRNARSVLVEVFEALTTLDPTFPKRFASLPQHGRIRRYLADNLNDLYLGREDLAQEHSVQLSSGWWLGFNLSRARVQRIVETACGVARIQYGKDLIIHLEMDKG